MELYTKLSAVGFLKKSYAYKFLFITFIGIHIPLIGLLFFALYGGNTISANSMLIFALIMTLLATVITLFLLKKLIFPIEMASKAVTSYRDSRIIPVLPLDFTDEAGLLLSNIQASIIENENFMSEKQDLVYLLSHDLRTFAGNSQALAKLILEENPLEPIKEYSELIYESTHQQFYFIESFIRLIREDEALSKKIHEARVISISDIFSQVKEQVSQQRLKKNIQLKFSIEVAELFHKIDSDLLVRVLVNLLDNAIKFSFANAEIKINVYVKKSKFIFEISDTGLGFDPNHGKELFEKFTLRSRLGTANEPSTGIGLYLCKKIIEKYKGELIAESAGLNRGSKFSILFDTVK